MRTAGFVVASCISLVALTANADTRAWTAAKAGLPSDAKIVIGLDVGALQKTQLFTTYYPKLLAQNGTGATFDKLKTECKIDPLVAVTSFVVATTSDQSEGAAYVSVSGIDRAKVSACFQSPGMSEKGTKVTVKQSGDIMEVNDGKATSYFGWVGKDVIVVPLKPEDKAQLQKWMGGKGALATSDVGKSLAKVNTSAALWGAGIATKEIKPGTTIKGGYGTVQTKTGNLDLDIHAVMASADQAKQFATDAKKQVDQMKQANGLPPAIAALAKGVTINAANDEVVVKANVVEKDLLAVIAMATGGMGGP